MLRSSKLIFGSNRAAGRLVFTEVANTGIIKWDTSQKSRKVMIVEQMEKLSNQLKIWSSSQRAIIFTNCEKIFQESPRKLEKA